MIEACIYFIVQQKNIDHFIVGVDSYEQLENIIAVLKKKKKKINRFFSVFRKSK